MSDQEINIKFVGEVKKHEVLYNYNLPGYSRKHTTEKAWQEVASKVNMSPAECKEKWRNLRTVFMRKMKPTPSGSGPTKKAYYLSDAMQFCLPFIKVLASPSSGNSPQVPQYETADVFVQNEEKFYATAPLDGSSSFVPPSQESHTLLASLETVVPLLPQHSTDHPVGSSMSTCKETLKQRNKSAAVADQCLADDFKAKKAKLETNENKLVDTSPRDINRKAYLKMFLLSLIPELEELSDYQIKIFKRRVFSLIDEISTPSSVTLLSPHSVSSHASDPPYTSGVSVFQNSVNLKNLPLSNSQLSQAQQFQPSGEQEK